MEKLIADVYEGRIQPRVAAGLAPLFSLQLRAVEAVEATEAMNLTGRLDKVEEALARIKTADDLKARRNMPAP